jgi:hypothetical protein
MMKGLKQLLIARGRAPANSRQLRWKLLKKEFSPGSRQDPADSVSDQSLKQRHFSGKSSTCVGWISAAHPPNTAQKVRKRCAYSSCVFDFIVH